MKTKRYYFLLLFFPLIVLSCAGKKVMVKNQVSTCYVSDTGKQVWTKDEARKQISLHDVRVLLVDATETKNIKPFEMPSNRDLLSPLYLDTLIENSCYNAQVLKVFYDKLPLKARVDTCLVGADARIRAGRYDAMLLLKKMTFRLIYDYKGMSEAEFVDYYCKHVLLKDAFRDLKMSVYNYGGSVSTPASLLDLNRSEFVGDPSSDLPQGMVVFYAEWVLRWLNPGHQKTEQILQEGILKGREPFTYIFTDAAHAAGESFYRIFKW